AVYSFRDLRDVTYSHMHKCARDFDDLVERGGMIQSLLEADAFFRAQPRTLYQRYERIVHDPVDTVLEIARHLAIPLDNNEAAAIVEQFSLAAVKQRAKEQEQRLRADGVDLDNPANALLHDSKTQIHWNHVREGRIGGWRDESTPPQAARLFELCGSW